MYGRGWYRLLMMGMVLSEGLVWVDVQGSGAQGVFDDDLLTNTDLDGTGGHQLGVEFVELTGILVGPQRESIHPTNQLECLCECLHHLLSAEAICAVAELRQWLGAVRDFCEVVHGGQCTTGAEQNTSAQLSSRNSVNYQVGTGLSSHNSVNYVLSYQVVIPSIMCSYLPLPL